MARQSILLGSVATFSVIISFLTVQTGGTHLIARRAESDDGRVERSKRQIDNNNAVPEPAEIVSMFIDSKTSSRYTQVQIHSVLVNNATEPRQAEFLVQIPEVAFISNFSMQINGTWYLASVMEKKAAEKEFEKAQKKGESAGHVSSRTQIPAPRGMDNFGVNINVAAESSVQFVLLYTELLERRLGTYQQRISVRPGQIVPQLVITAELYEPQGFSSFMFTPPGESEFLYSSREPDVSLTASTTFKSIFYKPTVELQKNIQNSDYTGLMGDFVIKYDVIRDTTAKTGGLVVIDNGYFVHYLSPSADNLQTLDKNVAFVIDVSGSMASGKRPKIEQTREAMIAILGQLRSTDYFNILLFSSNVRSWQNNSVTSSAQNIAAAKSFVMEHVKADGGTNIEAGLRLAGISLSALENSFSERLGNMIVFLTDGMPSAGVTDPDEIRSRVRMWNSKSKIPIFSLGFGEDVSIDFLQQLSWENYGFTRKIYHDTLEDAGNQLSNFFSEIESVLLVDISVVYDSQAVDLNSLTTNTFSQYFDGTELVIAGEISPSAPSSWNVQVRGGGKAEVVTYDVSVSNQNKFDSNVAPWSAGFAEKIRAYVKIRDLVRAMSIAADEPTKESLRQQAIELSLQYNFVTPVTSMVITQSSSSRLNPEHTEDLSARYAGSPGVAPKSSNFKPASFPGSRQDQQFDAYSSLTENALGCAVHIKTLSKQLLFGLIFFTVMIQID